MGASTSRDVTSPRKECQELWQSLPFCATAWPYEAGPERAISGNSIAILAQAAAVEDGGAEFSRGALYHLLGNPVYRGAIRHRDRLYPDAHAPIIDETTWSAVQAKLVANCPDHPQSPRTEADVMLRDLVFDDRGDAMRAIHTKRGARRYRFMPSICAISGGRLGACPGSQLPR